MAFTDLARAYPELTEAKLLMQKYDAERKQIKAGIILAKLRAEMAKLPDKPFAKRIDKTPLMVVLRHKQGRIA